MALKGFLPESDPAGTVIGRIDLGMILHIGYKSAFQKMVQADGIHGY
jgi:hypothetical protein